jgi:hypothetical protein
VAALLEPGGFLHLVEGHPVAQILADAQGTNVVRDYFREHLFSAARVIAAAGGWMILTGTLAAASTRLPKPSKPASLTRPNLSGRLAPPSLSDDREPRI